MSILSPEKLEGVHPDMRRVLERAAGYLEFPVRVNEGVRTLARQRELFDAGASRTMDSRHLTGHAVDLLSVFDSNKDGKVSLEELYAWPMAFKIASAMKKASSELNIPLVWGGCWDRVLTTINDPEIASAEYVLRRRKLNKKAFIDGPHFELARSKYP